MEEELSPERDGDKKWDEMTDAEKEVERKRRMRVMAFRFRVEVPGEVEGKVRGLRQYEWDGMTDVDRGVYLWQLRDTILSAHVDVIIDKDHPLYKDESGEWATEVPE